MAIRLDHELIGGVVVPNAYQRIDGITVIDGVLHHVDIGIYRDDLAAKNADGTPNYANRARAQPIGGVDLQAAYRGNVGAGSNEDSLKAALYTALRARWPDAADSLEDWTPNARDAFIWARGDGLHSRTITDLNGLELVRAVGNISTQRGGNGLNRHPVLQFTGARASTANPLAWLAQQTNFYVWAVVRQSRQNDYFFMQSPSDSERVSSHLMWGNPPIFYWDVGSATDAGRTQMATPFAANTWAIALFAKVGTTNLARKDGVEVMSEANTHTPIGTTGVFSLGNPWTGELAEILVETPAAAFSTAEMQRREGYLAWRYGLQGNLPADHPHRNAAPTS